MDRSSREEGRCRKPGLGRVVLSPARTSAGVAVAPAASGPRSCSSCSTPSASSPGYGLAEVTYFRDQAPARYWQHFASSCWSPCRHPRRQPPLRPLRTDVASRRCRGGPPARPLGARSSLCVLIAFWPLGTLAAGRARAADRRRGRMHVRRRGHGRPPVPLAPLRLAARVQAHRVCGWPSSAAATPGPPPSGRCSAAPGPGLVPVAVFDDDPRAHGLSLLGVPVVGCIDDIPEAASRYTIQQVLLAIPSPSPELVERALRASEDAGVSDEDPPRASRTWSTSRRTWPPLRQAREPRIEDLLGRTPGPHRPRVGAPLDRRPPGAGHRGRRLHRLGDLPAGVEPGPGPPRPARPRRDPPPRHRRHGGRALRAGPGRHHATATAVLEVFDRYRPEVVFHAAAHKHVPVLEEHPLEAANTNVLGTLNVVDGGGRRRAPTRFVQISTDKAVRPSQRHGRVQAPGRADRARPGPEGRRLLHGPVRQRARAAGAASSRPSPARSPRAARSPSPTPG